MWGVFGISVDKIAKVTMLLAVVIEFQCFLRKKITSRILLQCPQHIITNLSLTVKTQKRIKQWQNENVTMAL